MKYLCLIALLALTACGGSTSYSSPPDATPPVVTPPVSMVDAFFTAVLAMIGDTSDTKEPAAIDAVAVTTPETTEPEPVK